MRPHQSDRLNAQISEEAADWLIGLRTGDMDSAARREFDAWIRSSPEHLRAYLEMAAIWNESGTLVEAGRLDVEAMTAAAFRDDTVVPLQPQRSQGLANRVDGRGRRQFFKRLSAVAAMGCLLVTAASVLWSRQSHAREYTTSVGEQRTLTLSDGSMIEMNSRSRIIVRFSENEREIELLKGQALFEVAKDPSRPFIVAIGNARVRAIGTQFDIDRKYDSAIVTVLEGRVVVAEPSFSTTGYVTVEAVKSSLSAGEQVTLSAHADPKPIPANVSTATAWRQHELVLESMSLTDVAAEFNRYSSRTIIVKESGVHPLRLSGVFSTNPDFFIRYLRGRSDITIQETDSEIRIAHHN